MEKAIDFKKIIEAAAAEAKEEANRCVELPAYYHSGNSGEQIRGRLILNIWNECLKQLGGNPVEDGPLAAEKVVIALGRRGVSRDRMPFKSHSFRVKLDNYNYRIYKRTSGFASRPWNSASHELRILKLDADVFAEFLLEFDKWIPVMLRAVDDVYQYYKEVNREKEKKEMVHKILVGTVESIIEQRLRSLGLTVNYRFVNNGESVSLDIWQIRHSNLEVPIDELADRLRDPDTILDSLVTEESFQDLSKEIEFEPPILRSNIRTHWHTGRRLI